MNTYRGLEEYLRIGFVQSVVDCEYAWCKPRPTINMKKWVKIKAWQDIKKGFCNLSGDREKPHIVVLPELTVSNCYIKHLKELSKVINSVVIAGLDFQVNAGNKVSNKAVVVIPNNWSNTQRSTRTSCIYFGKTHFSNEELELFKKLNTHYKPKDKYSHLPDHVNYIIDAGPFGNIGVAICSDFFDIERFVIYKGKIHHMIVISNNMDTNSYYFLAEAIARLVFCNVVICNTGYYGDSIAFSPYREPFKRIIYRHQGQQLFSSQVVSLPVVSLDEAQRNPTSPPSDNGKSIFKSAPPGYIRHI
ncbi:hypothetical protein [Acetivibrio straminisolvens]|jgi:predicted amidohydrolase|uniref:hypothetical protein n=1 Tax=Acetivibrio straminisolvens TaxID=253314 RepID=UPI0022405A20|nr:hypothetical protein [Acetivibrio straminisolvens]